MKIKKRWERCGEAGYVREIERANTGGEDVEERLVLYGDTDHGEGDAGGSDGVDDEIIRRGEKGALL